MVITSTTFVPQQGRDLSEHLTVCECTIIFMLGDAAGAFTLTPKKINIYNFLRIYLVEFVFGIYKAFKNISPGNLDIMGVIFRPQI